MTNLVAGQNASLPAVPVALTATGRASLDRIFGLALVEEGAGGWLSLNDAPHPAIVAGPTGTATIDPTAFSAGTRRVFLCVYARRSASTMSAFLPATFEVGGHAIAISPDEDGASLSPLLIFAELYLRDGTWKIRARKDLDRRGIDAVAASIGSSARDRSSDVVHADRVPDRHEPSRSSVPSFGDRSWNGSAFLVAHGVAITNSHVVREARHIQAVGDDGRFAVETMIEDREADLAVVRIRDLPASDVVPLRLDTGPAAGETIYALGFPMGGVLGAGPQISDGLVSNTLGPNNDTRLMQITAPIQPGSSGGPVLDAAGRLVGVSVSTLVGAQNVNFAVRSPLVGYLAQACGVDPTVSTDDAPVNPAQIMRRRRRTLFRLECRN